jgi:D-3-phosphoglycerate dehydrogenase
LDKIIYFMPGFCAEELSMHSTAMILSLIRNLKIFRRWSSENGSWPKGTGTETYPLKQQTVVCFGLDLSPNGGTSI